MIFGKKQTLKQYINQTMGARQKDIRKQYIEQTTILANELSDHLFSDEVRLYKNQIKQTYEQNIYFYNNVRQQEPYQSNIVNQALQTYTQKQLQTIDVLDYANQDACVFGHLIELDINRLQIERLYQTFREKQIDTSTLDQITKLSARKAQIEQERDLLLGIVNECSSVKEACRYLESLNINLHGYYEHLRTIDATIIDQLPAEREIDSRYTPL